MACQCVTVRATILALGQFRIASGEDAKTLEKRWAASLHQSIQEYDRQID
jgi:hypothetical protein